MKHHTLAALFSITLMGCGGSSSSTSAMKEISGTEAYEVTFTTAWDDENFPTNYPSNRHFSGLIGANHKDSVKLFEIGMLASPGIRSMAESGSILALSNEIEMMQNSGEAEQIISGPGLSKSVDSITATFYVSQDFPLVSLVTMVAPSPDWFVGVDSLALFENGEWVQEVKVSLVVYDAGTDSGASFQSTNLNTNPAGSIALLSSEISDTDFLDGMHYSTSKAIGTFAFRRIE